MEERDKKQALQTVQYKRLKTGFKEWLDTLGYAENTVYSLPGQLNEFLQWLEQQGTTAIENTTEQQVKDYIEYFKYRPNKRRSGGLSIAHINSQIDTLGKFSRYLKSVHNITFTVSVKLIREEQRPERIVLSKTEIKQLYKACDNGPIGMRDRAMLAVYYGCGLRKAEGIALEVSDILFERRLLYVRKPKTGRERYVPINLKALQDIETYIYTARPLLVNETTKTESFFISERGKEIQGQSLVGRLEVLKARTGNPKLQNKSFGMHALRHSIATHLLQAGMELENIALFLGHKTLDSTQLYTHLVNERSDG